MARPTDYSEEVIRQARFYIDNYEEQGDFIPSVVGLCRFIGRSRSIVYDWAKQEDKKAFSDILEEINEIQERVLVNKGLKNESNPTITKLVLGKHGYSEKLDQAHTSPDGSMTPQVIERTIVDPKAPDKDA